MNRTSRSPKALDVFMAAVDEIRELALEIGAAAEEHFDVLPEMVDWGHVGNVTETARILRAEVDRIHGTGEFAAQPCDGCNGTGKVAEWHGQAVDPFECPLCKGGRRNVKVPARRSMDVTPSRQEG